MTEQAQIFDRAFGPLSFDSIIRANLPMISADVILRGEVYSISPVRCEICDCWNPDCEHLEMVKSFVASENRADDYEDQYGTYADALDVGGAMTREGGDVDVLEWTDQQWEEYMRTTVTVGLDYLELLTTAAELLGRGSQLSKEEREHWKTASIHARAIADSECLRIDTSKDNQ